MEYEQVDALRDEVTRRYKVLRAQDREAYNVACSILDLLGDAVWALQHFREQAKKEDRSAPNRPKAYLLLCGAFQWMYIQGDVLKWMKIKLGLGDELPSAVECSRELRNDAFGHPALTFPRKKRGVGARNHFLIRNELFLTAFTLRSDERLADGTEQNEHRTIDVLDLMDKHESELAIGFREVHARLISLGGWK